MTHVVDLGDLPCNSETITSQYRHTNTRNLKERKGTSDQLGTTVIEASFFFFPDKPGSSRELWLHENCGDRDSAEHDLGKIVIKKNDISRTGKRMLLKLKLDISEEGLLRRKPILEMSCATQEQIPITWESSSLSFSNNNRMDNVRVQLAEEMKTFHHQYNLTVDGYVD
jgi:hypothetical protein